MRAGQWLLILDGTRSEACSWCPSSLDSWCFVWPARLCLAQSDRRHGCAGFPAVGRASCPFGRDGFRRSSLACVVIRSRESPCGLLWLVVLVCLFDYPWSTGICAGRRLCRSVLEDTFAGTSVVVQLVVHLCRTLGEGLHDSSVGACHEVAQTRLRSLFVCSRVRILQILHRFCDPFVYDHLTLRSGLHHCSLDIEDHGRSQSRTTSEVDLRLAFDARA